MESSRRQQAKSDLGLTTQKEQQRQQESIQAELARKAKKENARYALENDFSYRTVRTLKTVMDDYYLDPILGLLPGGIGDIITSLCTIPYIYVALCKVKSVPLTLAVLYNMLKDVLLGLIPFWIGDIIDAFYKSNKKNYRLIVGYVEDNEEIISEVNRNATKTAIIIAIFCLLIYYMVKWTVELGTYLWDTVASWFA